ncbi:hypothetical protein VB774_21200 [Pseudanabaena galeata UHCC 0370]|uniref:Uncharacterized protein n=1 Tax=Pseudanabaena galeata UHCC 0370 TaxID=3110310 RepID=A0ABU5TPD8_9CYAN|nr:hypothetical protein [Pseudanabaena galeata]MEA5480155.1 hypothetical protein [Pseudanabaena galeata UHCC 0370]
MIITIDLLSPKNQTAIAPSTPKITIASSTKSNSDHPSQHPKHHDRLHKNQIVKALQDKMSVQGFNSDLNLSMKNFP